MSEKRLTKNIHENTRNVPVYEVAGKILDWDANLLPLPKHGTGILIKDEIWDENPEDEIHPERLDAIFNHNRTVGTETDILSHLHLFYIDGKGTSNYLSKEVKLGEEVRTIKPPSKGNFGTYWGLLNYIDAKEDHKNQKLLKSWGVRTHESIGIIELDHLYYKNKKYSVEELKRGEMIEEKQITLPPDFIPVQQIRAFGTPYRIEDLGHKGKSIEKDMSQEDKILHAMHVWESELGYPLDPEKYLFQIFTQNAKNIATIHAHGFLHRFTHPGNFTLDGRITDLDSVSSFHEMKIRREKVGIVGEQYVLDEMQTLLYKDFYQSLNAQLRLLDVVVGSFFKDLGFIERQQLRNQLTNVFFETYKSIAGFLFSPEILPMENPDFTNIDLQKMFNNQEILNLIESTKE